MGCSVCLLTMAASWDLVLFPYNSKSLRFHSSYAPKGLWKTAGVWKHSINKNLIVLINIPYFLNETHNFKMSSLLCVCVCVCVCARTHTCVCWTKDQIMLILLGKFTFTFFLSATLLPILVSTTWKLYLYGRALCVSLSYLSFASMCLLPLDWCSSMPFFLIIYNVNSTARA